MVESIQFATLALSTWLCAVTLYSPVGRRPIRLCVFEKLPRRHARSDLRDGRPRSTMEWNALQYFVGYFSVRAECDPDDFEVVRSDGRYNGPIVRIVVG